MRNIRDRRWKCSHIWYSAITSSHTYALSFLLIIHRVFRETGFWRKKTKIAFLWLFSLILFQLISSKVKEDRGQVEQIISVFAQCLFHICWEPNSYLLWNKFILVGKQILGHLTSVLWNTRGKDWLYTKTTQIAKLYITKPAWLITSGYCLFDHTLDGIISIANWPNKLTM